MFWGLPISFYRDLARMEGAMDQLPLFETPPHYEIKMEYVCDVFAGWKCTLTGTGAENSGLVKHVDHPAFTALRNHLKSNGYINKEERWHNGDVVTNAFYLNGLLFLEGDKFPCATAQRFSLEHAERITKEKFEELVYLPVKVDYNKKDEITGVEWV